MIFIIFLLLFHLIFVLQTIAITYHNDYEPLVFDYLPLNCYDCLSYRDIILTQLSDVPARAFENFNLGSRDTYMILNGQMKLILHPYAFQSLIVQKPNKTLTITLAAPNSWLNITENTFNGLELYPYSTLRIIIKFFYGCTFHKNSLSGIKMDKSSHLIIDISSVTEIIFENNIIKENDFNSSVEFLISRTDTILFESYSFFQLNINLNQIILFHFELISHIHFKSYSFRSLQLTKFSSFRFYSIFLNRLTIDSYAFDNMLFDSNSIFNFTIRTLGTCLCFKSYSFNNLHTKLNSENLLILFQFYSLRGLSFLSNTFSNLSLNNPSNQLKISSINSLNDPNPIINFAINTFSTKNSGLIILNFSEITLIRFEYNSIKTNSFHHEFYFKDISLIDFSLLDTNLIRKKFYLYFDNIQYIKWYKYISNEDNSLIQYHFNYLSNSSCFIYSASRSISWIFSNTNLTICNCPLLYAYKHGQLDGQIIPCLQSMSGYETAREIHQCSFQYIENFCQITLESLFDNNNTHENSLFELDYFLIRQLYDKNYLSCSLNYSSLSSSSTIILRSRLFNHFGLVLGIILSIFIFLLILVIALLNGLQYKMREYDETWTWRRNMSWTTLRRTLSQTSLRRSRRDLRTINNNVITSKSDNQLDRLRYDDNDQEFDYDLKQSQSIQEDFKKTLRI